MTVVLLRRCRTRWWDSNYSLDRFDDQTVQRDVGSTWLAASPLVEIEGDCYYSFGEDGSADNYYWGVIELDHPIVGLGGGGGELSAGDVGRRAGCNCERGVVCYSDGVAGTAEVGVILGCNSFEGGFC